MQIHKHIIGQKETNKTHITIKKQQHTVRGQNKKENKK